VRHEPTLIIQLRHWQWILPYRTTYRYPDNGANRASDGNTDSYADSSADGCANRHPNAYSDGNRNIYSHDHANAGAHFNAHGDADKCGRRIQRGHLEYVAYPLLSDGRGERYE